ncbi:hypothetical protein DLJ53_18005 [Acuticoccus sediminis]|uniref:GpW protein n=1 Tax=Acuticoccus sediminis TaxID=2184697 RepID=A0A8B2NS34_9HYPH|nr:hypothetical protein [Acuticoccus sediminis]RAI01110.1 hypothetical protein DLJ53_18005 [Acuticoccus sediminis]
MPETASERFIRLREIRTAIATGDTVAMARFGDDEVRYFQANLSLLEREIADAEREADIEAGGKPKRTRFAIRGRMMRP